jgi:DNA-binding NarL/FixJ family response regulator
MGSATQRNKQMSQARIILVDDHSMFRGALSQTLAARIADTTFQEAGSLDELQGLLDVSRDAEMVLLDLNMPNVSGLTGLLQVRAQYPEIAVVVVSGAEDRVTIRKCLDYGASGFVPKSAPVDRIIDAISTVRRGDIALPDGFDPNTPGDPEDQKLAARLSTLTPQQIRVLRMLGEGLLNKQIAFKLNVSEATIKAHVSAILQKLDVDSRTQAVILINKTDPNALPRD